ncbi:hypothetical protein D3C80_1271100 [compost metagenome]
MRKKLTVLSTLLFISGRILSQDLPKESAYLQDSNLDKFVGTWEYNSKLDSTLIIIELHRVKLLMSDAGFYYDTIIGVHTYIKRGVTMETSAPFNSTNNYNAATIMAIDKPFGTNQLKIKTSLKDITKKKRIVAYLEIQPDNPNALLLSFQDVDGIRINQEKGFTMPTNILLTKR